MPASVGALIVLVVADFVVAVPRLVHADADEGVVEARRIHAAAGRIWRLSLGGHLRRNGQPGWQILTRGYHELLVLEEGWLAARGGPEM